MASLHLTRRQIFSLKTRNGSGKQVNIHTQKITSYTYDHTLNVNEHISKQNKYTINAFKYVVCGVYRGKEQTGNHDVKEEAKDK